MPLTDKGKKIMASMLETYGTTDRAKEVFHASKNKGTISGVEKGKPKGSLRKHTQKAGGK